MKKFIVTRTVLEEAVAQWALEMGYKPDEIKLRHMQTTPIYYHVAQKVARGENKLSRSMTARELYAWLGN
jgi:hypothetical protein